LINEERKTVVDKEARRKAIDDSLKAIEKFAGKGAIMMLGDTDSEPFKDVIPTGSLALDKALGIGGVPKGRIIEIFGDEGSGKTTLALNILANVQKMDGVGAFIDVEHALDPNYAKNIGVDTDGLIISQPDSGEQALEICETLAKGGGIDLIIVDSVAALVPRAEIEGEVGDAFIGLQARMMSQALRKLTGIASKCNVCVVFINQLRYKIGVMFGNPKTTPGGLALKFHASVRMEVYAGEAIKEGDVKIGSRTRVKVVKNKMAPPFNEAIFTNYFGKGINHEEELVDLGVANGIIEKSGAWYSYKGEKISQGKEAAMKYLVEKPEVRKEVETEIKKALKLI
jgi:recombination protein RecA